MSNEDIVLGIDLGTTNSAACIYRGGEFEIIPSDMGYGSFPSVVAVNENGDLLVGQNAKKQMVSNAENSVANVKLFMGKDVFIRFNGEDLRPQQISALILAHIKRNAESYLGKPIKKAIISVPATFDDDARKATIEAGQIAGFEVETIVNEPTAACLAYTTIKDIVGTILVFDMGGGTLDITVGSFDGEELVPQSTVGYGVGGRNITIALRDYVQKEFEVFNGLKLEDYVTPDYDPLVSLTDTVETAVIELSSTKTTKIHIPSIVVTGEGERINLDMDINRSKLIDLSNFVIERCERGIADALSEANLTKEDIDYLVFIGEYTKMPLIRESVEKTLGITAVEGIDPSLCVAQGASIHLVGPVTVPIETKINNINYDNQTYQIGLIEDEFKSAGYDKKLIDDLSSKFNGLTIKDKEVLIKIMGFFKNSDLSFKDLHDLICANVLEGNMSLDSFYKNRELIAKSRINEKNRKIKRTIENQLNIEWDKKIKEKRQLDNINVKLNRMIAENEKLKNKNRILEEEKIEFSNKINNLHIYKSKNDRKLDRVEDENEKLKKEMEGLKETIDSFVNENWDLTNRIKILEEKNWDLINKINTLQEKNGELSNQLDSVSADNYLSLFGGDFKNANSMNMISGINHEDYQKDLEILVSKQDIPEDEFIIFEAAFDEYDAGNFNEAYELFNKFSGNFKWPQKYIDFLKATSLSRDNKIQEAYEMIDRGHTRELRKKYNTYKYPILWFNFGNIYFDYANSQSGEKGRYAFHLARFCYNNAKYIVSEKKFRQEYKSNYTFNFKDGMSKKDFENNVHLMSMCADVCDALLRIRRLKEKIGELKDKKEKNSILY